MKKTLFTIALLLIAVPVSAMTLWDYYQSQGQNLPSIADRQDVYHKFFDDAYTGSAEQNTNLVNALQSNPQALDNVVDNSNQNASPLLLGATLPQGVAVFQTSLLSAITSSASSMSIVANSVRGGSTLSGYNCFTVDEGSSIAEYICGTVSGTSVTSLTRGIDPVTGTTTNATLQFAHRRGAEVKITDFPVIQIMKHQLSGEETFDNVLKYNSSTPACSANDDICKKSYIDGVAVAGASNANTTTKGIVEIGTAIENASTTSTGSTGATLVIASAQATSTPLRGCDGTSTKGALCSVIARNDGKIDPNFISTSSIYRWSADDVYTGQNSFLATSTFATTTLNGAQFGGNIVNTFTGGETITAGKAVMFATSSAKVYIVDSDVASTTNFIGFAINNCSTTVTCYVQTDGIVSNFSGLTAGARYFVNDTPALSTTQGTIENYVGMAVSTSQIFIDKGMTSSDQYTGTQSLTCTSGGGTANVVNNNWARKAVINFVLGDSINNTDTRAQVTIYKIGATTVTYVDTTNVGAVTKNTATFTWTNGTITALYATEANSCTATAYYYR